MENLWWHRFMIQEEIDKLNAELASLRKDKERLDWLEASEGLTTCGFAFKWFVEDGKSLREAIDQAIVSMKGERE